MTKRAVQYLRMSTDVQRFSLASQAALISDFAIREGYEVTASYEDAGRSGVTTSRRDGLKALMRDVLNDPPFGTILVTDVSRWGRYQDPDEAAHYEFLCRSAGVEVRYCAEGFLDDGTPAAALMKALKRSMAAEYSRQLSDRCRAGIRRAVLEGAHSGGEAPYGFSREAFDERGSVRQLQPGERAGRHGQRVRLAWGLPEEVAVLRRIFEMYVTELRGPAEIARILNSQAVPYKRSGPWNHLRVTAVLTNEAAIGTFTFGRSRTLLGRTSASPEPADLIRVKMMKPMVQQSLFKAAQVRLSNPGQYRVPSDALLAQLRRLLEKQGYLTRASVEASPDTACLSTFDRRFGSLSAAYALIGYRRKARNRDHVHSTQMEWPYVEKELAVLLAEHGYLTSGLIRRCGALPSVEVLRRRFGPMETIYKSVGYYADRGERLRAAWKRRP